MMSRLSSHWSLLTPAPSSKLLIHVPCSTSISPTLSHTLSIHMLTLMLTLILQPSTTSSLSSAPQPNNPQPKAPVHIQTTNHLHRPPSHLTSPLRTFLLHTHACIHYASTRPAIYGTYPRCRAADISARPCSTGPRADRSSSGFDLKLWGLRRRGTYIHTYV